MAWNEPGDKGNGKDPWSGRDKEQSPPDLDEVFRKFQRKLNGLTGKSGGSDEGGFGGTFFIFIAMIVVVAWALAGIFIVSPAEEAVVLRFGQYQQTLNPGPHWIPRFIDSKYTINVQRVSNFSYNAHMLTKDQNIVSVSLAVQFRIDKPRDFLFNLVNPIESLQQATASALRQVIGHTTLDSVLTTGREEVRQQVTAQLNKILKIYNAGLMVTDVVMQPAKAPEEVKAAFDDAIKAQEDEQRFINQAQAYSKGVQPIAEGRAQRALREAQAYQEQVVLAAQGDVSRFLAILPEYKRAPQVTRERLYLDAVESVLSKTSKILVDTKAGNNLLYLPIDKLIQQSAAAQAKPILKQFNEEASQVAQASQAQQSPRKWPRQTRRNSYRQGRL